MNIQTIIQTFDAVVKKISAFDFIPLLAVRLLIFPAVYVGARSKVLGFHGTVAWFSNSPADGGLGLPFPEVMAFLATSTEVFGCICIALGLCTRLAAIPMIFMMSVAGLTVHWPHGWASIATKTMESTYRLTDFMQWLKIYFPGRYNYITELGDPVILNNGIEFATTYFVLLLVLFVYGGGRYVSLDYWIKRYFNKR
ncbi:MAG: DoxX family protein [Gammaproteobacteria bacterium]|nr:DoxX family protein [Gammaproteobacteria bacterium]MCD8542522.1 DoxX family protein [Gammaproteobacteria bacterium]